MTSSARDGSDALLLLQSRARLFGGGAGHCVHSTNREPLVVEVDYTYVSGLWIEVESDSSGKRMKVTTRKSRTCCSEPKPAVQRDVVVCAWLVGLLARQCYVVHAWCIATLLLPGSSSAPRSALVESKVHPTVSLPANPALHRTHRINSDGRLHHLF